MSENLDLSHDQINAFLKKYEIFEPVLKVDTGAFGNVNANYGIETQTRNLVLQRMHDLGEITEQDLERAKGKPIRLSGLPPSKVRRAPYAVDAAIERVEGELGQGALSRGVNLHTTIHPLLQRAAVID